ncbi:MAG: hypothetical protein J6A83_04270 [Clostridia bacterium]|nr:hypothetical protein [Clostridia bacterium]
MTDKEKVVTRRDDADGKSFLTKIIKSPSGVIEIILTAAFMLLSLWTLMYYITGPALGYFHSDCSDSLLWSRVMLESGEVLSEDFAYAAILPFGSPIWMVPILKIFGYTMKAHIISMCVFTVIFLLSALFMFRSMKWKYSVSSASVFCLSMLLSGSVKLREIMWEHVIYYSLGILFLMLLLGLVFRLYGKISGYPNMTRSDKIWAVIYALLLLLLCAGCATDGAQVLALTVLPVAGALVAYTLFDRENKLNSDASIKRYVICGVMAIGAVIGFIVLNVITKNGEIYSGYGNAYSGWSAVSEWKNNADLFFTQYFTLFGISPDMSETLFSAGSILTLVSVVGGLIVLVCPFILLFSYNKLRDEYSKIVAWAHLVVTAAIMVGFICGRLSNVNWRLTPFLGSSIIATVVYVKHLLDGGIVFRRVGAALAAVLLCVSVSVSGVILDMPKDFGKNDPLEQVADRLEEEGYTRGYATFWNASETTLRSDSAVEVVTVEINNGTVLRRAYQTMNYWFDDVEGQENYFLLLDKNEYAAVKGSLYYRELIATRNVIDDFECADYHIIVFDSNIF